MAIGQLLSPGGRLNLNCSLATAGCSVQGSIPLVYFSMETSGVASRCYVFADSSCLPCLELGLKEKVLLATSLFCTSVPLLALPLGSNYYFKSFLSPGDPLPSSFSSSGFCIPASRFQIPEGLFLCAYHSAIFWKSRHFYKLTREPPDVPVGYIL